MFGYVAYHIDGEPPYRAAGGARFRAVYVARGESLRARLSARAAARTLRREGVRCAVFPPDYPYVEVFARYGVTPPPLAPLYRATAAAIARRYLARRGVEARNAAVALAAESVTPELRRAAYALRADTRYIVLAVSRGGDALARQLRRDFGVAARIGSPDTLPRSDPVLVFDDTPAGSGALRLDETLRVEYDSELPNELLAALWHAGALDADALRVRTVGDQGDSARSSNTSVSCSGTTRKTSSSSAK